MLLEPCQFPVKRKSKSSRIFRENGKNRKKFMRHNLNDDKREQLKENDRIRRKQMCDNLDNKKGNWKRLITKGKKEKCDNFDTHEKELLKNMKKKK